MMEGNWIAMPGVPLITAGNPEAAAVQGGNMADTPGDCARAAEGTTGATSDEVRTDRVTRPSDEVECTEAAVDTIFPALASLGAAAAPEVDAAPAPDEAAPVAVITEENAGNDTSETAHAAELEAALLAASSPGHEDLAELAAAAPAEVPVVTTEAEV
jgi:hypothetical protein